MTVLERINASEVASHASGLGTVRVFGPLTALRTGRSVVLDTAWHDGTRVPTVAELRAVEDFYGEHGQPALIRVLSHAAVPLLGLLRDEGYTLDNVLHVYAHQLERLPAAPHLPVLDGVQAAQWAQCSALGFGKGSEAIMAVVAHHPQARLFAVPMDSELAGTAAMQVHGDVAALYGTSTRPEFRGRGVQTAMLSQRLHAAKAQGATLASVFVTPGAPSERNIARAGFQLAGMRLTFMKEGQRA